MAEAAADTGPTCPMPRRMSSRPIVDGVRLRLTGRGSSHTTMPPSGVTYSTLIARGKSGSYTVTGRVQAAVTDGPSVSTRRSCVAQFGAHPY